MGGKAGAEFRIHVGFYPRKHIHKKLDIIVPSAHIIVIDE